jgi:ribosome assembly protein 1
VLAHEESKAAVPADGTQAEAAVDEVEEEEDAPVFSPELGNVAFGSAFDGWAFRLSQFAEIYSGG